MNYYPHGDDGRERGYIACGKITTGWGPVELAIEMVIVILRNRQKAPVENHAFVDFPVSFSRKAREIRDRLRDDRAVFEDLRPHVVRLLAEATQIHARRDLICHSDFQGVTGEGGSELIFCHSEQKRGFSAVWKHLTFDQMEADFKRMPELADEFGKIARQILERGLLRGAPPFVPVSRHDDPAPTE